MCSTLPGPGTVNRTGDGTGMVGFPLTSSSYIYVCTRLRVRKAGLLPEEVYMRMLGMDIHEITRFLGEHGYGTEIHDFVHRYHGIDLIEVALSRNLASSFQEVIRITPGPLKTLTTWYLNRWDIINVMGILRALHKGLPRAWIRSFIVPAGEPRPRCPREDHRREDGGGRDRAARPLAALPDALQRVRPRTGERPVRPDRERPLPPVLRGPPRRLQDGAPGGPDPRGLHPARGSISATSGTFSGSGASGRGATAQRRSSREAPSRSPVTSSSKASLTGSRSRAGSGAPVSCPSSSRR